MVRKRSVGINDDKVIKNLLNDCMNEAKTQIIEQLSQEMFAKKLSDTLKKKYVSEMEKELGL